MKLFLNLNAAGYWIPLYINEKYLSLRSVVLNYISFKFVRVNVFIIIIKFNSQAY